MRLSTLPVNETVEKKAREYVEQQTGGRYRADGKMHVAMFNAYLAGVRNRPVLRSKKVRGISDIDANLIIKNVARTAGMTVKEMLGDSQDHRVLRPRQLAAYLLRTELGMSLPEIARKTRREYTTARSGIDTIVKLLAKEDSVVCTLLKQYKNRTEK